jgi:DNA-binding HxlR family transcriptional regulator
MKGYGQYCPVAKGAEVFAERWTPLVLRELLSGSTHFSDLHRGVPLMSRSLLSLDSNSSRVSASSSADRASRARNTI